MSSASFDSSDEKNARLSIDRSMRSFYSGGPTFHCAGQLFCRSDDSIWSCRLTEDDPASSLKQLIQDDDIITAFAVSSDASVIVTYGKSDVLTAWDPSNGTRLCTWKGSFRPVVTIDILLVNGDQQSMAALSASSSLSSSPSLSVNPLVIVAAGYADGSVRLWQLGHPGAPIAQLKGHSPSLISLIRFFPQETLLVTGSVDGKVRLWKYSIQQQQDDDHAMNADCKFRMTTPECLTTLSHHTSAVTAADISIPTKNPEHQSHVLKSHGSKVKSATGSSVIHSHPSNG